MVDGIERDFPAMQVFRLDFNDETDSAAARALRATHHPTIVLIDPEGQVHQRIPGPPDEQSLRDETRSLLP